jgi:hypothetical protein
VLRESGLIRQVDLGNSRTNALRLAELRRRFPGLVDLLMAEAAAASGLVEAEPVS